MIVLGSRLTILLSFQPLLGNERCTSNKSLCICLVALTFVRNVGLFLVTFFARRLYQRRNGECQQVVRTLRQNRNKRPCHDRRGGCGRLTR